MPAPLTVPCLRLCGLRLPHLRRARLRTTLLATLLTSWLVTGHAAALHVPLSGWQPVSGDARQWAHGSGACVLREERHGQAFPTFARLQDAQAFALRLQNTLRRQGVSGVVTQPVERSGTWGVLAAYTFRQGNVSHLVSQLYLSDRGLLRTVTGSSVEGDYRECVNAMREFIRYAAN